MEEKHLIKVSILGQAIGLIGILGAIFFIYVVNHPKTFKPQNESPLANPIAQQAAIVDGLDVETGFVAAGDYL